MKIDYRIKSFSGPSHPRAPLGSFLRETVHQGQTSRDMEIAVYRERMKSGEIGYIEVTSYVEPVGTKTIADN